MSHHYDERGAYPSNSISGDGRHSDALDALEGVIKDGFSMSQRYAHRPGPAAPASGSAQQSAQDLSCWQPGLTCVRRWPACSAKPAHPDPRLAPTPPPDPTNRRAHKSKLVIRRKFRGVQ